MIILVWNATIIIFCRAGIRQQRGAFSSQMSEIPHRDDDDVFNQNERDRGMYDKPGKKASEESIS